MVVGNAVGPFSESRLDEALGLAVGLGTVGPREAVLELERATGLGEGLGAEAGAVVGEDAFGLHAQRAEVGNGVVKELRRARFSLVRMHVGEAEPGVVIDGDEQVFPAGLDGVVRAARDAFAHAHDAPELLGVDVDEIARTLVLVAHDRLGGFQVTEPRQPGSLEDTPDGALGDAQARRDPGLREAPAAQLDDRQRLLGLDPPRAAFRFGGAVSQTRFTLGEVSTQPFASARSGDAVHRCRGARRKTVMNDVANQFQSTDDGESGILVNVHSAELPERLVWFAPSSLSNSVRMNRYNLLGHHS